MTTTNYGRRGLLVSLLALSACAAVGPDPNDLPVPTVQGGFAEGEGRATGGQVAFWGGYNDAMLNQLISSGLGQSFDILSANEAIRAARADMEGAGVLGSQVSGTGTGSRQRAGGDGLSAGTSNASSLSAAFVFDLFGGARRDREGKRAAYQAAEADLQTTRLAWLAEVISAYSDARYYQQAMALTRETISSRQDTLDVTRNMAGVGVSTQYDVAQTEALLQTAQADLPNYEAQFNAQVYRLSTLLNLQAQPLLAQMKRGSSQLRTPPSPGTGVPADLLRARPDIRSAQYTYAQALAQVGVATADMLPSVSLSGNVSDSAGNTTWGFGPSVSIPVLNQTALGATRKRRMAEARQAEIAWKSSVASAVEDVQTAQSNLRRYRSRAATLEQAASSYSRAYTMARENFEAGELSLLDLLEADRSRFSARLSAAVARNAAAQEWATLQIATGAGSAVSK